MGLLVQPAAHLHGHRGIGVLADIHQRAQIQAGDDQALGKHGYQGIVLAVHMRTHTKGRPRTGGIVHIHHRLRVVHAQDLQNLFRQRALGIVERWPKTAVEIPGPGQHAMAEQRGFQAPLPPRRQCIQR